MTLDRRRHAVREDLADARLRGQVAAPRFAEGQPARLAVPVAPCRRRPADDAPLDTEFLFGEPLTVFDVTDGWAWVQSEIDGYVGYVAHAALAPPVAATHRVAVPLAIVYRDPSIKAPPTMRLPMGAVLQAGAAAEVGGERFHALADGGYVLSQHLCGADEAGGDWVDAAETFLGAPYLFGGRTWDGLDCSALVQVALGWSGRAAPRDSDMQAAELGAPLAADAPLTRGDLVFWSGHVGVMRDATHLLHANGHHMLTASEPLAATVDRLKRMGLPVTARRRIGPAARVP